MSDPTRPPSKGASEESTKALSRVWPDWFSARRLIDFARRLYSLQSSVARLEEDCKTLRNDIAVLQQQQAAQSQQLEILARFVETAINERIDIKAENAAYRVLASLQRLPKREEPEKP